ncbi:MAG: HEAT repeat domain-containing protein [Nitrospira sp.]|nr:HEAT repeat domain-containing protein [Nitrospira sp.]MCP9442701.1 HEAT repeat domain-containing protein [Nitrospira sp.]
MAKDKWATDGVTRLRRSPRLCLWGITGITWGGFLFGTLLAVPMEAPASGLLVGKEEQQSSREWQTILAKDHGAGDLDRTSSSAANRQKIRSLLREGNPKEALTEYDRLTTALQHDDLPLLQEIALGFVAVMVNDMREQMRGAAYTALKEWRNPGAIPFFEDGLKDRSGLVRALAAEGLGKFKEGYRSTRFRDAVDDEAALVKAIVLKAFGKSGDGSVIALVEPSLEDPEARVRVAATEALCRLGRTQNCTRLEQFAASSNPEEAAAAIASLTEWRGALALPFLLEASRHTQPSVRGAAASGFAQTKRPEALEALARLLHDPVPPVRVAAAVSLGQFPAASSVPLLQKALDDHDASVQSFVIGSLLELGESYQGLAQPIATLSTSRNPATRAALARALGRASAKHRKDVRPILETLCIDTISRVRMAALKAVAKLEGMEALPLLKQGLHDEDDAVRATAGGELLYVLSLQARQGELSTASK